jgi:uncharacterized protein (DUF1778 family)
MSRGGGTGGFLRERRGDPSLGLRERNSPRNFQRKLENGLTKPNPDVREVISLRLSHAERAAIEAAARRARITTLSEFLRQAALQAAAMVENKVSVKPRDERQESPKREVVVPVLEEPPGDPRSTSRVHHSHRSRLRHSVYTSRSPPCRSPPSSPAARARLRVRTASQASARRRSGSCRRSRRTSRHRASSRLPAARLDRRLVRAGGRTHARPLPARVGDPDRHTQPRREPGRSRS